MPLTRTATVFLTFALLACGVAPTSGGRGQADQAPASAEPRTIIVAFRYEKNDLSTKTLSQAGQEYRPLFNAGLAFNDGAGVLRPYLAEGLPQLNTESWRVLPDGRMETTWRLKPNLTWHDGTPLAAADFVFAWRVYSARGLGIFSPEPQNHLEETLAPDARTVVFRWADPYPEAGTLTSEEFPPLPQHLLATAFEGVEGDPVAREAFINHRYWNPDYVGAGAYRLDRLEPGASVEGVAFDGHALGRPKIDRIIGRIFSDENPVLSSILAENIQVTTGITLRFEHAQVLLAQWSDSKRGNVLLAPARLVGNIVQFRPEYLKTPALLDVRIRRAMVHSIDRQAMNDAIFEGKSINPDTYVTPGTPHYPTVDRAIAKYAYDPARTEQLMAEAGFTKGADGFFANPAGERFRPDLQVLAGTTFERGGAILNETWRRAGIDVQLSVLPAVQVRQNDVRNQFPGLSTPGGTGGGERGALEFFTSGQIGSPANNWTGSNRGGWVNPDMDRVWQAYNVTLDQQTRFGQMAQLMKTVSDELPGWPLFWDFNVMASLANIRGPSLGIANTSTPLWNVHEWEAQ
jgi:peptide/nickel transport system substrate-binding protein